MNKATRFFTADRIAYDEPICRAQIWCAATHAHLRQASAALRGADPAARSRAVTRGQDGLAGFAPREILLAAAARAVLAAFREPLEKRSLSPQATATLRLLEAALEPYRPEPPPPRK